MSLVIRRINLGKWKDYSSSARERSFCNKILSKWRLRYNAPADAITSCLKTINNDLSVWVIDDKTKLDSALLAMATGSKTSGIGTVDYLVFDYEELEKTGILIEQSIQDADTAVPCLRILHHNLRNIHYDDLGKMQDLIVSKIKHEKQERKTSPYIWNLIEKALDHGCIDDKLLSDKLKCAIQEKYKDKTFVYKPDSTIL